MNKWSLEIDVKLCINCRNCVLATKDEYVGNGFPGYSVPHPSEGLETIKVERHIRGECGQVEVNYIPKTCNHCDDAPCIKAAADGSVYKRPDGIVMIDPVKAKGRQDIVDSCPYGMIKWNAEQEVPQNWIFDAHLLDDGWKEPRCSQACPTKAIRVLNLDDNELLKKIENDQLSVLNPEFGTKPRVFYKNLDEVLSHMVAGNICEKGEDGGQRNLSGIKIVMVDSSDGCKHTTTTDHFGDFRFSGLKADSGMVELWANINESERPITTVERTGSINLGTLYLTV